MHTLVGVNDLRRRARLAKMIREGRARQIRQGAHITLEAMGAPLGVTKAAVSAWELGRRFPERDLAHRYYELLEEIEAELVGMPDAG